MALNCLVVGLVIVGKLSVSSVGNSCAFTVIPDETTFRECYFASTLIVVIATAASITGGPGFLHKVVGISRCTPVVSVGTHFSVHIEIVEEYVFTCEPVLIRGHFLRKKAEIRIAISAQTGGQITQNLVVGPVFLDNVKNIPDRGGVAHTHGYGIAWFALGLKFAGLVVGAVFINQF